MKMTGQQIIENNNKLVQFINKKYAMPWIPRRAVVKNYTVLQDEAVLLNKSLEDIKNSEKDEGVRTAKIRTMLGVEIDVNIIKIPEDTLNIDGLTPEDELLLRFMVDESNNDKE